MGNGQGPERPRKTRLFRRRANSSLPLTRRFGKTFAPRFFLCNSSDWSGYKSGSLWHQYHSLVFEAKFLEAAQRRHVCQRWRELRREDRPVGCSSLD